MFPNSRDRRSTPSRRARRRETRPASEPLEPRCLLSRAAPPAEAWPASPVVADGAGGVTTPAEVLAPDLGGAVRPDGWRVWLAKPPGVVADPTTASGEATQAATPPGSPISGSLPVTSQPASLTPPSQPAAPEPAPPASSSPTSLLSSPVPLVASFVTGVEGVSYLSTSGLIDPAQGGRVTIGSESLNGAAGGPRSLDSDFHLGLGVMGPDGLFTGPWLDVSGHLTGSVAGQPGTPHLSGGFDGAATSAVARGVAPGSDAPTALADLARHPGRIHVSGAVTGGYRNDLVSQLVIDPPALGSPAAGGGGPGGRGVTRW